MPAACRAASAAHMRRGVERQPRLSSHPCHARRRAPCAPVGALAALHQPARRGAMHPGHCVGRQPACPSTEQERMLRTLAQHQLASNQALSPLHSRPRAPAAALLNAQAQEPPLVVAALCSAACEQRSARQTRGTPGRLWDGGPPSECEPHRRPCLPQPRASGAKRQRRACFSVWGKISLIGKHSFISCLRAHSCAERKFCNKPVERPRHAGVPFFCIFVSVAAHFAFPRGVFEI